MTDLSWMIGRRFESLQRDGRWIFRFNDGVILIVECSWRLLAGGRICVSSDDHGHWFGLRTPADAPDSVSEQLGELITTGATVRSGTLDLYLTFDSGYALEVIPTSTGYEAWGIHGPNQVRVIACGGGELAIFSGTAATDEGARTDLSP